MLLLRQQHLRVLSRRLQQNSSRLTRQTFPDLALARHRRQLRLRLVTMLRKLTKKQLLQRLRLLKHRQIKQKAKKIRDLFGSLE